MRTLTFPHFDFREHDFLEIVRLTDKVQRKKEKNCITAEHIRRALLLYSCAVSLSPEAWVTLWGGFSFKDFKFKSHCTELVLSVNGGYVRRVEAPERKYGKGHKFQIAVKDSAVPLSRLLSSFPGFVEGDCRDEILLIISGD